MLSDFKSDSKDYSISRYWIEEVPFTPIPGELNKIIFNIDPTNLIDEYNGYNNRFIKIIDLRPLPPQLTLDGLSYQLVEQTLNNYLEKLGIINLHNKVYQYANMT